uniref:WD_REPEATS_REGION domain-containing protein n=1 Tax=Rhabditophanes sp. KR3021 TaxID=114890 RepID=A0AC35U9F7_9BILA
MFRVDKSFNEESVKSTIKEVTTLSYLKTTSHKILLIFPTIEEFAFERDQFIKHIFSELQIYAAAIGIDLEWFSFSGNYQDYSNLNLLNQCLAESNTIAICFLGNKIGNLMPPLEIESELFDRLQQRAFETSLDVKLLDKAYILRETKKSKKYILQKDIFDDVRVLKTLCEMLTSLNTDTKQPSKTFIETIIDTMMTSKNANYLFVMRKFNFIDINQNDKTYSETTTHMYERIEGLKNVVTDKVDKTNYFTFMLAVDSHHFHTWTNTRDGELYGISMMEKLTEKLKAILDGDVALPSAVPTPLSPSPLPPQPHSTPLQNPHVFYTMFDIAKTEQYIHQKFYIDTKPKKWSDQPDISVKTNSVLALCQQGNQQIQLVGKAGIGKTAHLLKIHELLQQKDDTVSFIRFLNLTANSLYDHEVWRNILYSLDECAHPKRARKNEISFEDSIKLGSIFKSIASLVKTIGKKVYVLLDDVNLMQSAKLAGIDQIGNVSIPNLFIISTLTKGCTFQIVGFSDKVDVVSITPPTIEESIEIIKTHALKRNIKISPDCLSNLRLYLASQKDGVAGGLAVSQLLEHNISVELKTPAIINVCNYLEKLLDKPFVEQFFRYLIVAKLGLTALELSNLINFSHKLPNLELSSVVDFTIAKKTYQVLTRFSMLFEVVTVNERQVYRIAHHSFRDQLTTRYIQNGDTQLINSINGELATIYFDNNTYGENDELINTGYMFPQPYCSENGSINLRKVSTQWKYLLYSANIPMLKELTLCNFEYVEAALRSHGLGYVISMFDEACLNLLDHDLLVFYLQVITPSVDTLIRDTNQLAPETIGRLRYTRQINSNALNTIVEQAMGWVDMYERSPLLVPLTCWISPPKMDEVFHATIPNWDSKNTIVKPTVNYQHLSVVKQFKCHSQKVTSISVAPDGKRFASTSLDGSLCVWTIDTTLPPAILTHHKSKVLCSLFSHDSKFIVSGSSDSSAKVIDLETKEVVANFPGHIGSVICLQLTSNDEFLIVGSGDFAVMVYSIDKRILISRLEGLMAPVTCMALTTNDAFVVVACEDETVRVYSLISSQELHELSGHEGKVNCMAVSLDDCQLFVGTISKIVCYDLHNSQIIDTLECSNPIPVSSVQNTIDNSFVVAGCGNDIHMWNIHSTRNHASIVTENKEDNSIRCVKMNPDEKFACCGTSAGIVAFWDLEVCQCKWTQTHLNGSPVTAIDFSMDSFYLATGCSEGRIAIWEADRGQQVKVVQLHDSPITSLYFIGSFAPIYKFFTCDELNVSNIWQINPLDETPNFYSILQTFSDVEKPLLLKKYTKIIIGEFSKNKNEMQIYHLTDGVISAKSKAHHNEKITCYNIDRNEKILVTGSADQSLKIWQLSNGYLTQVLVGHEEAVTCCAVSDKGHIVVSNSKDKRLIIWDAGTGTVKCSLKTAHLVKYVEMSADGLVILSADCKGWIEAWSSTNGSMLSSFNTYNTISSLIVSVDGNRILAPLVGIPQLPILCLHNTPALVVARNYLTSEKSLQRINSTTSYASRFQMNKIKELKAKVLYQLEESGRGVLQHEKRCESELKSIQNEHGKLISLFKSSRHPCIPTTDDIQNITFEIDTLTIEYSELNDTLIQLIQKLNYQRLIFGKLKKKAFGQTTSIRNEAVSGLTQTQSISNLNARLCILNRVKANDQIKLNEAYGVRKKVDEEVYMLSINIGDTISSIYLIWEKIKSDQKKAHCLVHNSNALTTKINMFQDLTLEVSKDRWLFCLYQNIKRLYWNQIDGQNIDIIRQCNTLPAETELFELKRRRAQKNYLKQALAERINEMKLVKINVANDITKVTTSLHQELKKLETIVSTSEPLTCGQERDTNTIEKDMALFDSKFKIQKQWILSMKKFISSIGLPQILDSHDQLREDHNINMAFHKKYIHQMNAYLRNVFLLKKECRELSRSNEASKCRYSLLLEKLGKEEAKLNEVKKLEKEIEKESFGWSQKGVLLRVILGKEENGNDMSNGDTVLTSNTHLSAPTLSSSPSIKIKNETVIGLDNVLGNDTHNHDKVQLSQMKKEIALVMELKTKLIEKMGEMSNDMINLGNEVIFLQKSVKIYKSECVEMNGMLDKMDVGKNDGLKCDDVEAKQRQNKQLLALKQSLIKEKKNLDKVSYLGGSFNINGLQNIDEAGERRFEMMRSFTGNS